MILLNVLSIPHGETPRYAIAFAAHCMPPGDAESGGIISTRVPRDSRQRNVPLGRHKQHIPGLQHGLAALRPRAVVKPFVPGLVRLAETPIRIRKDRDARGVGSVGCDDVVFLVVFALRDGGVFCRRGVALGKGIHGVGDVWRREPDAFGVEDLQVAVEVGVLPGDVVSLRKGTNPMDACEKKCACVRTVCAGLATPLVTSRPCVPPPLPTQTFMTNPCSFPGGSYGLPSCMDGAVYM